MPLRYLTQDEISYITDDIPIPPGIGTTALKTAHQNIKNDIRFQLLKVKVVDNPELIDELKERIIDAAQYSEIDPGTSIGLRASYNIGEMITQLTLNAIHSVGDSTNFQEIFSKLYSQILGSADSDRSPEMTTFPIDVYGNSIHRTLHSSDYTRCLRQKYEMEETTLQNLYKNSYFTSIDESLYKDHLFFRQRVDDFNFVSCLCIVLDTYRMYTHRITMKNVADAIEQNGGDFMCVWKSQTEGKIYVLMDDSRMIPLNVDLESERKLYYRITLLKNIGKIHIKGIRNIEHIDIVKVFFREAIKDVITRESHTDIIVSQEGTRWRGVSLADIASKFDDSIVDEENYVITTTKYDKKIEDEFIYSFRITGSNIDEFVWRRDIDKRRTIASKSQDIIKYFGLDIARILKGMFLKRSIEEYGRSIDTRHISVIMDFLVRNGSFLKTSSISDLSASGSGLLANSTNRQTMKFYAMSALFGDSDDIRGVSSSMFAGTRPKNVGGSLIFVDKGINKSSAQFMEKFFPDVSELLVPMPFQERKLKMETKIYVSSLIPEIILIDDTSDIALVDHEMPVYIRRSVPRRLVRSAPKDISLDILDALGI